MTGSSSIRLLRSTSHSQSPPQIVAPTPQRRIPLTLNDNSSDNSDNNDSEEENKPQLRSTTPALPPPPQSQINTASQHLEQRRRKAEQDAKLAHAQRILDREIQPSPRPASFHHHHHHHLPSILRPASAASTTRPHPADHTPPAAAPSKQPRTSRRPASFRSTDSNTRRPHKSVVAIVSARHRAAAQKKEAVRRQARLKKINQLDPLLASGALDEDAARVKKEREVETTRALQRDLELTLPGRNLHGQNTNGAEDDDNLHHNWEVVDTLDVVDPGVATVAALTNVANSIMFPYLPALFNRMPIVDLPLEATAQDARSTLESDKTPLVNQPSGSWAQNLRRRFSKHPSPTTQQGQGPAALEEGRADSTPATTPGTITTKPISEKTARKQRRAERRAAHHRAKNEKYQQDPLDTHVETLLNNRKRAQARRVLKGLWAFLKTPQGIIVGIYGFLVVFTGAALVIFLLGWIDHGNNKDFWVEVFSQAVNALFTITGVGLIPWRVRDTYRMGWIFYYQHLTRKLRRKAHLPPLKDSNDLPDPQAAITELEERKTRIVVDGKQYGEGDYPSEPPTPVTEVNAGAEHAKGVNNAPGRTGTPLQTIPESNSAAGGLTLANATASAHHHHLHHLLPHHQHHHPSTPTEGGGGGGGGGSRSKTPVGRVKSPFGRTSSPIPRAGTASPSSHSTSAAAAAAHQLRRPTSITWEPVEVPTPGGPTGHFVERPSSAAAEIARPGSAPPVARVSPLHEKSTSGTRDAGGGGSVGVSSRNSVDSATGWRDEHGYFHFSRRSLDGHASSIGGGGDNDNPSSSHLSTYFPNSEEETQVLQDIQVLSPAQAEHLHVLQTKFAHGASWYRPHETPTHRAFPIRTALWITILNDGNSMFQCMLCGVMWGFATHYQDRPAWTTGSLIPFSFLCGIGAGVLIARGSKKTKKTDEVEERLRAAFAERERKYLERKKRLAEELSDDEEEDGDEDDTSADGDEDGSETGRGRVGPSTVSQLEAAVAGSEGTGGLKSFGAPTSSSSGTQPEAMYHLNYPSPVRPVAHRGVVQSLSTESVEDDDDEEEDEMKDDVKDDGNSIALTQINPHASSITDRPSAAAWRSPEEAADGDAAHPMAETPHPSGGALSSLQHFEDALDEEGGVEDQEGLALEQHHILSPIAEDLSHNGAGGAESATVRAIERQEEREEEQTEAGIATAFFGLGGVQGVKGPQ
ncbi:hypothetical protein A4X09_0g321 [Tilletia walkeri]|uniref:Uncharacterized protein n=1 Tax=Tilletia walkeri TaxID=117179 RepID=A0A8X7NE35_9BASI|nr:hypothetical protein A4X09_0g321 [Tilletia walkeri]